MVGMSSRWTDNCIFCYGLCACWNKQRLRLNQREPTKPRNAQETPDHSSQKSSCITLIYSKRAMVGQAVRSPKITAFIPECTPAAPLGINRSKFHRVSYRWPQPRPAHRGHCSTTRLHPPHWPECPLNPPNKNPC